MFDDETQERIDRFMKVRVNEGLKIDPETAEVDFQWVDLVDPYENCLTMRIRKVASGDVISRVLLEVTFGWPFTIYRKVLATRYGTKTCGL